MRRVKNHGRLAVLVLLLGVVSASACDSSPTYDRDDPAGSMQAMSADLAPEEQRELAQAVGVLVGDFAFQAMAGDGAATSDPVMEERLDRMDGMTAREIIEYGEEVRADM